mmetsp:Transcript_14128/g.28447  ORF Transcript_14128/g.28447 Transcript_14128/m.28447 type:complete len:240 (-) Transcript_14128:103-822(-)
MLPCALIFGADVGGGVPAHTVLHPRMPRAHVRVLIRIREGALPMALAVRPSARVHPAVGVRHRSLAVALARHPLPHIGSPQLRLQRARAVAHPARAVLAGIHVASRHQADAKAEAVAYLCVEGHFVLCDARATADVVTDLDDRLNHVARLRRLDACQELRSKLRLVLLRFDVLGFDLLAVNDRRKLVSLHALPQGKLRRRHAERTTGAEQQLGALVLGRYDRVLERRHAARIRHSQVLS